MSASFEGIFMNIYAWRKNFSATVSNKERTLQGKLAFKTKDTHWLDTHHPVVVMISIHSAFHEVGAGDLKMNALISVIRSSVKGKVTLLICDRTHVQTRSLLHQNNLELAFEECLRSSNTLVNRYQSYFKGCSTAYWHSYICQDKKFKKAEALVRDLYQNNDIFRDYVNQDAQAAYTNERMEYFLDRACFIEKSIEDILEQCAGLVVLSEKGVRFQFYPGNPCKSTEYLNRMILTPEKKISWVHVFLTIEKKKIIPT